jgi:5-methylthioadenosine/S-adenosylhomocysteine deaminase
MVTSDAAKIAGLADKLGAVEAGRPADLAVFERMREDPWESVAVADPSFVQLVMIGGDVAYGEAGLIGEMFDAAALAHFEKQIAWGKQMLLDTSYQGHPKGDSPPPLSTLRADLIKAFPQVGPIFA